MITTKSGKRKRTINELRSEFSRVVGFLKAKTSSRSGFKKVQREMIDRLGMPKDVTEDEKKAFWRVWNNLPERPYFTLGSEASQRELYDIFSSEYEASTDYDNEGNFSILLENVKKKLRADYESIGMNETPFDPSDYVRI